MSYCCICQNTQDECVSFQKLSCNHEFHNECLEQWYKVSLTCPLCKSYQINDFTRINEQSLKIKFFVFISICIIFICGINMITSQQSFQQIEITNCYAKLESIKKYCHITNSNYYPLIINVSSVDSYKYYEMTYYNIYKQHINKTFKCNKNNLQSIF